MYIFELVYMLKRSEKGEEFVNLVSYNKEHDPKDVHKSNITAMARVMVCIRQMSVM